MDSKIEQVKKILYQGYLTDIAARRKSMPSTNPSQIKQVGIES